MLKDSAYGPDYIYAIFSSENTWFCHFACADSFREISYALKRCIDEALSYLYCAVISYELAKNLMGNATDYCADAICTLGRHCQNLHIHWQIHLYFHA